MNLIYHGVFFLKCFLLILAEVSSETKQNGRESLPQRLSPLFERKFETSWNETKYSIVLSNKTQNTNWSVIEEVKNVTHVLGRNNDTAAMQSGSWTLLMYRSGDVYNETGHTCNGTRRANILIYCNIDVHTPELKLVEYNQHWKNDCFYVFELATCAICPSHTDEGLSRGSVFCIIFLTSVGVYLIIGICYRRMVVGAKGFEQIPHHKFWTRLGNLQADGCNLVCRREEEETWQRLTSNPKDTQDDQDDALLRP